MRYVAMASLIVTAWARASVSPPLVDVVRDSEVIVRAKVKECGEGWAYYAVSAIYKGTFPTESDAPIVIRVAPVLTPGTHPPSTLPQLQVRSLDEEAVLFLKRSDTEGEFSPVSFGQWRLEPHSRDADLKAIEHLLQTWTLPDEARQMDIMMNDLKSGDPKLEWPVREFIAYTAARSRNALAYKDHFLSLLTSENPQWRSLGLTTVQEHKIEEAIPPLIKLTRDSNPDIVGRASLALRHYNTPEVVKTLTGLMEHPSPRVRIRAIIDTDEFPQEQVIQGLIRLSYDPDPGVRAMVPRGFAFRSAAVHKTFLRPILMRMIHDSDARVRASAFDAFGQNREQIPIDLLTQRLAQEGLSNDEMVAILGSLYMALVRLPPEQAKAIITEHEDRLISLVMREEHHMIGFHSLNILAIAPSSNAWKAMEKAANEHPLMYVRDHAKHLLDRRREASPPEESVK